MFSLDNWTAFWPNCLTPCWNPWDSTFLRRSESIRGNSSNSMGTLQQLSKSRPRKMPHKSRPWGEWTEHQWHLVPQRRSAPGPGKEKHTHTHKITCILQYHYLMGKVFFQTCMDQTCESPIACLFSWHSLCFWFAMPQNSRSCAGSQGKRVCPDRWVPRCRYSRSWWSSCRRTRLEVHFLKVR